MRALATSAVLTLFVTAVSAVPAVANHTPSAEDNTRIEDGRWLSGLEAWQQSYDVPVTDEDTAQRSDMQDLNVKMTPTEVYIIRWYPEE